MKKRKAKLRAKIGEFMRRYSRKAHGHPTDRVYSREFEEKIKRMRPEDLSDLLDGEDDDKVPEPSSNSPLHPPSGAHAAVECGSLRSAARR